MSSVEEFHLLNLDQRLLKAVANLGWKKPTDIQQAVIPLMFEGKSIVVQAKTGSGKTAAFAIPILNALLQEKQLRREQTTTVLILAPTKELCGQVCKNLRLLCKYAAKSVTFVDVSQFTVAEILRPLLAQNPDIVIGTPSKIISHLRAGHFTLSCLKCVVVDEADLMFTFGYQMDMHELRNYLPNFPLQAILMSATLDDDAKVLRKCLVKGGDWVRIELPDEAFLPSDTQLTQYIISAEEDDKYTILIALLKLKLIRGKTLIFANSVDRCFKLRLFMEEFGIRAALLNSELPVLSRAHAIDQFNRGVYDYLLAADEGQSSQISTASNTNKKFVRRDVEYGVSRGIDFQHVSNVINFDFPLTPALYVHRVGRTARADQMGTALSFVSRYEEKLVSAVEVLLNPAGTAASEELSPQVNNLKTSVFRPYQFRLSEVDGFRYRAMDVLRRLTRKVIREARLKEIKLELLNSERLKGYFEDHTPDLEALRHDKPLVRTSQPQLKDVPDYLVPPSLRALLPTTTDRHKRRTRWRRENLNLGDQGDEGKNQKKCRQNKKANFRGSEKASQAKHKLAKKRRTQDPLFSFGRKKARRV